MHSSARPTTSTPGNAMLPGKQSRTDFIVSGATAAMVAVVFHAPFWIGHNIGDSYYSFGSPPSSRFGENSIMLAIYHWANSNHLFSHSVVGMSLSFLGSRWLWDGINFVLLSIVCILSARWLRRSTTIRTFLLTSLATLGILLIVTPWFFSWYVTWLVGLAAITLPVREIRPGSA